MLLSAAHHGFAIARDAASGDVCCCVCIRRSDEKLQLIIAAFLFLFFPPSLLVVSVIITLQIIVGCCWLLGHRGSIHGFISCAQSCLGFGFRWSRRGIISIHLRTPPARNGAFYFAGFKYFGSLKEAFKAFPVHRKFVRRVPSMPRAQTAEGKLLDYDGLIDIKLSLCGGCWVWEMFWLSFRPFWAGNKREKYFHWNPLVGGYRLSLLGLFIRRRF